MKSKILPVLKRNSSSILFFSSLLIFLTLFLIKKTVFVEIIPRSIITYGQAICLALLGIKITMVDKLSYKQVHFMILTGIPLLWITILSGNRSLVSLWFWIFGANNIDFKKIVKIYAYYTTFLIVVVVLLSLLSVIPNLNFPRPDGTARFAFGFVYPTDFAAYVFYCLSTHLYLIRNKNKLLFIICSTVIGCVVWKYSNTRLDVSLIFMLVSLSVLSMITYKKGNVWGERIQRVFLNLNWLYIVIIIIVPMLAALYFNHDNFVLQKVNDILSGRLYLAQKAILDYGYTFFGQTLKLRGFGMRSYISPYLYYFYVDSSYFSILLRFGIVGFILVLALINKILNVFKNSKDSQLGYFILLLILVNSAISHHFLEVNYNIFLLAPFALLNISENGKRTENSN